MLIETSRFGPIEVDEEKLIQFPEGLFGFPDAHRFALLQTAPDPALYWLQSADDPVLAFVVCDPCVFVPDYQVPVRKDDVAALELRDLDDCQVLAIVNRVDAELTANLLGPLVIGVHSRKARQIVLSDKRYGTRHRLVPRAPALPVARTA